jgi:hypothetical protein
MEFIRKKLQEEAEKRERIMLEKQKKELEVLDISDNFFLNSFKAKK